MLAVLLALVTAVSYGGSDYVAGLAARRASVVRVTVLAELANCVIIMPIVPFISRQAPSLTSVLWAAGAGFSGVAGAMALYLGFRHAAFSVASSVSAVGTAAFSALAGFVLGERPGTLPLVGIALALPAIVTMSVRTSPPHKPVGGRSNVAAIKADWDSARVPVDHHPRDTVPQAAGVLWGLIAGAGFALLLIGLNRAGSSSDLWPLAIADLAGVVTATCGAAATRQLRLPPAGTRWLSVLTGVSAATGTFAYFLATHRTLLAVTAVISSLYPAGTIMLARVVSGERLTALRIVGLCIAGASVALIAIGRI